MAHSIVWFKRDLRISDHAPLWHATRLGPVTCIYIIEPIVWSAPDAATQHYQFVQESLADLKGDLASIGLQLHVLVGEATECLTKLHALKPFDNLYSHQETGNAITYTRDLNVARWCKARHLPWHQYQQFGVTRGPHNRNQWQSSWEKFFREARFEIPVAAIDAKVLINHVEPPSPSIFGLGPHDPPKRLKGGSRRAWDVLNSFLEDRSAQYRGGISSPLSATTACSRLSAYMTWGCISMKDVVQTTRDHLANNPMVSQRQAQGLRAFMSRLYWHCHFIQKLEDEPSIECQDMHAGYQGLRQDWQESHFEALKTGRTGWPMVDASVMMLREKGWLNFRMRAMLVSVAAYPLWLDWPKVGHWLATQFLDYEPGIHWSQMQMQSGTTGINVTRIYNPIKQAQDHDPSGRFVRQWLPALRTVPDAWIFEPWRMPPNIQQLAQVKVGQDIVEPIVDLTLATRLAKTRFYERRSEPTVRAGKAAIVEKHGSRKRPVGRTGHTKRKVVSAPSAQLSLDFFN
jgi:deoxyribodipyrimidine photo-lyase